MQNWNNWSMNIKRSENVTPRPGGAVSTLPTVLPDSPGSRESIPGGSKNFVSSQSVKTGAGVHPALHLMGTVQSFPRIKWPQHESEHASSFRAGVKFVMCT